MAKLLMTKTGSHVKPFSPGTELKLERSQKNEEGTFPFSFRVRAPIFLINAS